MSDEAKKSNLQFNAHFTDLVSGGSNAYRAPATTPAS